MHFHFVEKGIFILTPLIALLSWYIGFYITIPEHSSLETIFIVLIFCCTVGFISIPLILLKSLIQYRFVGTQEKKISKFTFALGFQPGLVLATIILWVNALPLTIFFESIAEFLFGVGFLLFMTAGIATVLLVILIPLSVYKIYKHELSRLQIILFLINIFSSVCVLAIFSYMAQTL